MAGIQFIVGVMLVAICIFVLGFLFGMAMQRAAYKNVARIEDLTDWEGDHNDGR